MSQFEQEIRTSLTQMQTQLVAVQQQADRTNASVARIGPSMRVAASGGGELQKSVGGITAAATRAGGPIAGMITQLGGLAAFNPMAMAAGVAIGGITAAVYSLVGALRQANEEQDKLNAVVESAPGMAKAAGETALRESDPNKLRYGVSSEQMQRNLAEFQKGAPGVNLTEDQKLQVSLGMGDADPAAARSAILRSQAGKGGRMADIAEELQASANIAEAGRRERLLLVGSGQANNTERTQSALENSPELRKSVDALTEAIKADELASRNGWQFGGSEEQSEQRIREKQVQLQSILDQAGQSSK